MAKKNKFDGVIMWMEIDAEGYVNGYDKNDRACWGSDQPERVVLLNDLRKYASGLHIGQLGWTIPDTTDGYKWIDVRFDNGITLPILTFGITRVVPARATEISRKLIGENQKTRFDADPEVAAHFQREWLKKTYDPFVDSDHMVELGAGDQTIYAFTFPSLQALATLRNEKYYPIKIGFTTDQDGGAVARIQSQMFEASAFPERPTVLLICRTVNGRACEMAVHARLRELKRHIKTAPGTEWFLSNCEELTCICEEIRVSITDKPRKPLAGSSPNLIEAANGGKIEVVRLPNSAFVGLRIGSKTQQQGSHVESAEA